VLLFVFLDIVFGVSLVGPLSVMFTSLLPLL